MIKIKVVRALDILSELQVNVQFKLQTGYEILHQTPSSTDDYSHAFFLILM